MNFMDKLKKEFWTNFNNYLYKKVVTQRNELKIKELIADKNALLSLMSKQKSPILIKLYKEQLELIDDKIRRLK